MQQRTKGIIAAAIIILLAILVVWSIVIKRKSPTTSSVSTSETNTSQQTQPTPKAPTQSVPNQQTNSATPQLPSTLTGKVVGMTSKSIIVERPQGALEIGISVNTPITSATGKASIIDVKAGTNVTVEIDTNTKQAKSISIGK